MAKVGERMLDIGPAPEQIGLNMVLETAERQLISDKEQVFEGKKTFSTPPLVISTPIANTNVVTKKDLMEYTRCIGNVKVETLTVTEEDIANGYIKLSEDVAPNQTESLEILYYEGSEGLVNGLDFGVGFDSHGKVNRLVWQGWPLGIPGKVIVGQEIKVSYNYCKPSIRGSDFNPDKAFLLKEVGSNIEARRLSDNKVFTAPLPSPLPDWYPQPYLSDLGDPNSELITPPAPIRSAFGKLLLCRIPRVETDTQFEILEYDGTAWVLKLTVEMPELLTQNRNEILSRGVRSSWGEQHEVLPLSDNLMGLLSKWEYETEVNAKRNFKTRIVLRIYSSDYTLVETKSAAGKLDYFDEAVKRHTVTSCTRVGGNVYIETQHLLSGGDRLE